MISVLVVNVNITEQRLYCVRDDTIETSYLVSTSANGVGEQKNSYQTPRGKHIIRACIGEGQPINTVFVSRRPTGEIYSPALAEKQPDRDWILTRILWLSGKEMGKNRLGSVDTFQRFIYIHGTPDSTLIGQPHSHGCIRMRNKDIIDLFNRVSPGVLVTLTE